MDLLQDDLSKEFDRIRTKIEASSLLSEEDLKIILISMLKEEEQSENK
jgi:hypothetical protein